MTEKDAKLTLFVMGAQVSSLDQRTLFVIRLTTQRLQMEPVTGIVILEEVSEILNDHVGVIICLHKPVIILKVMLVNMSECQLGFAPQVVSALSHF